MENALHRQDSGLLIPRNLTEAKEYAKIIASSRLVPNGFHNKPEDVLVAMQMGAELGLKPMQALQNIAVINGRAALWGDAMLAVVRTHPEFEFIEETQENAQARCIIKRKGQKPHQVIFSLEDAKKANLLHKPGPWSQHPKRMCQMRARSFALRDTFPDALRGLYCAEEVQDIPVVASNPIQVLPKDSGVKALSTLLQAQENQQEIVV